MGSVRLENISKRYGEFVAVSNLNLDVNDKEFIVLLGPSGCGKTTTLNIIAGLLPQDEGRVYIDGNVVDDIPPEKRNLAMVFQSYALYPTMTVFENIAFPLKILHMSRNQINEMVKEAADLLRVGHLLNRKPHELSGGERQRVALGRALVRKPRAFLLDEPLANLDAKLRISMRAELKKLHEKLGTTFLYVTHDQAEAMTMADRIAVMNSGQLVQYDIPDRVFYKPSNVFVATFVGSPAMNTAQVRLTQDAVGSYLELGDGINYHLDGGVSQALSQYIGEKVVVGIRPDDISIFTEKTSVNCIPAKVFVVEPMGTETIITLQVARFDLLTVRVRGGFHISEGDEVFLDFPLDKLYLFDKDSGNNIIV